MLRSQPPVLQNVTVFVVFNCVSLNSENEAVRVSPDPIWLVSLWEEKIGTLGMGTCRGKAMWGHSEKEAVCRQRTAASGETSVVTLWSWTYGLQNCEKMHFCCWSHPACGTLLWHPTKWTCRSSQHKPYHSFPSFICQTVSHSWVALLVCLPHFLPPIFPSLLPPSPLLFFSFSAFPLCLFLCHLSESEDRLGLHIKEFTF